MVFAGECKLPGTSCHLRGLHRCWRSQATHPAVASFTHVNIVRLVHRPTCIHASCTVCVSECISVGEGKEERERERECMCVCVCVRIAITSIVDANLHSPLYAGA